MAGSQSGGSVTGSQTARSDRHLARQARAAVTHGPVQHSPRPALQSPLPAAELEVQEHQQADDDTGREAAVSRTASSVRSQQNIAHQNDAAEAEQLLDRPGSTVTLKTEREFEARLAEGLELSHAKLESILDSKIADAVQAILSAILTQLFECNIASLVRHASVVGASADGRKS